MRCAKLVAKIFTPFISKLGQRCREARRRRAPRAGPPQSEWKFDARRLNSHSGSMYRVCTVCQIPRPGPLTPPPPVCSQTRARARVHKCATTDRRYALMQTPAQLRMPQERAAELTRRHRKVLQTPKLYFFLSRFLLLPTFSMANSRYFPSLSPSFSLSLFHRIFSAPPTVSPHRSLASYFFLLTYCILISCFFLFFFLSFRPRARCLF